MTENVIRYLDLEGLKALYGVVDGKIKAETDRATTAEKALDDAIKAMDLNDVAATGKFITAVHQTDGKVTVDRGGVSASMVTATNVEAGAGTVAITGATVEDQIKDLGQTLKTVEGNIVHEHCHNEAFFEKRGDILVTRGMRIFSRTLGVVGQCDVVEFYKNNSGALLSGHVGRWMPYPIEYKRGKIKSIDADRLQLCGQAICLEQMLGVCISKGAIYYHETNRREEVVFTDELREQVSKLLCEMHNYYLRGYTPVTKPKSGCKACSLRDLCLPVICMKKDVDSYYNRFLSEEKE